MQASEVVPNRQYVVSGDFQKLGHYISCPASLTMAHSSGKVSSEWPGMKKVVLISYLAKSSRSRRTPTVPAKSPERKSEAGMVDQ